MSQRSGGDDDNETPIKTAEPDRTVKTPSPTLLRKQRALNRQRNRRSRNSSSARTDGGLSGDSSKAEPDASASASASEWPIRPTSPQRPRVNLNNDARIDLPVSPAFETKESKPSPSLPEEPSVRKEPIARKEPTPQRNPSPPPRKISIERKPSPRKEPEEPTPRKEPTLRKATSERSIRSEPSEGQGNASPKASPKVSTKNTAERRIGKIANQRTADRTAEPNRTSGSDTAGTSGKSSIRVPSTRRSPAIVSIPSRGLKTMRGGRFIPPINKDEDSPGKQTVSSKKAAPVPVPVNYYSPSRIPTSPVRNIRTTPSPKREWRSQTPSMKETRKRNKRIEDFRMADINGKIPNYDEMTKAEQAQRWTEFEMKFNDIRDYFEDYEISLPDRNKETLTEVHARYRQFVLNIHKKRYIDEEISEKKAIMIIIWVVVDLILDFFGINIGYAKLQMRMYCRYRHCLKMLGEEMWEAEGGGRPDPMWTIIKMNLYTSGVAIVLGLVKKLTKWEVNPDSVMEFIFGVKPGDEASFANDGANDGINIAEAAKAFTGGGGGITGLMSGLGSLFSGMNGGGNKGNANTEYTFDE